MGIRPGGTWRDDGSGTETSGGTGAAVGEPASRILGIRVNTSELRFSFAGGRLLDFGGLRPPPLEEYPCCIVRAKSST